MVALLLALLPACCAAPTPPAPPPAPPPEAQAPPPPHPRPVLRTTWSFQTGPDSCVALARAGAASLRIAVRRNSLIQLTVALPGGAPDKPVARFSGPAGHWLVAGAHSNRGEGLFALRRDETSLSRILMLLSGGTLSLTPADPDLPILSLPESGADGQKWFACVRGIVIWT